MRPFSFGVSRPVWLAAMVLVVLGAVDAGSVMLTRLSVPDDVRRVGHVAAAAAYGQPTTRKTAQAAFAAAQSEARHRGIVVTTDDFALYPDGRVTLTAQKTAPTLLVKRIEALSHFAEVQTTVTVEKLPYS
jgi:hypothetical protein